jgi:Universal stress protein family
VLHVCERGYVYGVDISLKQLEDANELVERHVRRMKDAGQSARGEVVSAAYGCTARGILDLAEDEGVDLIVMGTRGLSVWSRLMVGSVANGSRTRRGYRSSWSSDASRSSGMNRFGRGGPMEASVGDRLVMKRTGISSAAHAFGGYRPPTRSSRRLIRSNL